MKSNRSGSAEAPITVDLSRFCRRLIGLVPCMCIATSVFSADLEPEVKLALDLILRPIAGLSPDRNPASSSTTLEAAEGISQGGDRLALAIDCGLRSAPVATALDATALSPVLIQPPDDGRLVQSTELEGVHANLAVSEPRRPGSEEAAANGEQWPGDANAHAAFTEQVLSFTVIKSRVARDGL